MKRIFRLLSMTILLVMIFTLVGNVPSPIHAAGAVTKITLNHTAKEMVVGQTLQLKVSSVEPSGSSQKVTFKTSKKSVATVNSKGVVTAKKKGTATITAVSVDNGSVMAKCKITVLSYKVPPLRIIETLGSWPCDHDMIAEHWADIYPYYCKYIGEPEKISKDGITWSWSDNISNGDLVGYSPDTNSIQVGPLPHHDNLNPGNLYDYEPLIMQMMHETAHMFNQQGDALRSFDFGQWAWEAAALVAENMYYVDRFESYNMHNENTYDLINHNACQLVNGVKSDGNKFNRNITDAAATVSFFYLGSVLSDKGSYNYWRDVNDLRTRYCKANDKPIISIDEFGDMLDEAANGRTIDGLKPSDWLKAQPVANFDGNTGDFIHCYSIRPFDSYVSFVLGCWNRYIDEDGSKKEKGYKDTDVRITVKDPAGKTVASKIAKTGDNGSAFVDMGTLSDVPDNTALKVTASANVGGRTVKRTTYQISRQGLAADDNSTYLILTNKKGNILTNVKASKLKITGAVSVDTTNIKRGVVIIKGEVGSSYSITYKDKTYTYSQPECIRVIPVEF